MSAAITTYRTTADHFLPLMPVNARHGPVTVHFCTPRAGPCRTLLPRFEAMVRECGRRLQSVPVDAGREGQAVREAGICPVPGYRRPVYRDGNVTAVAHGPGDDTSFRRRPDRAARIPRKAHARPEAERIPASGTSTGMKPNGCPREPE